MAEKVATAASDQDALHRLRRRGGRVGGGGPPVHPGLARGGVKRRHRAAGHGVGLGRGEK
jgi:hypothetical protein